MMTMTTMKLSSTPPTAPVGENVKDPAEPNDIKAANGGGAVNADGRNKDENTSSRAPSLDTADETSSSRLLEKENESLKRQLREMKLEISRLRNSRRQSHTVDPLELDDEDDNFDAPKTSSLSEAALRGTRQIGTLVGSFLKNTGQKSASPYESLQQSADGEGGTCRSSLPTTADGSAAREEEPRASQPNELHHRHLHNHQNNSADAHSVGHDSTSSNELADANGHHRHVKIDMINAVPHYKEKKSDEGRSSPIPTDLDAFADDDEHVSLPDDITVHTTGNGVDTVPFKQVVKERAGWLVGLLVLQSCSSFILERNEALLQSHLVIVHFLTMLVGAGGNAGNQASVRVIRGLAVGTLNNRTLKRFLLTELKMAICLSCILGISGLVRAAAFRTPAAETVAITASLFMIVIISIGLGALMPLAMKYCKIDPAHSSTTIQVVMDILGVTITVHVCSAVLNTSFGTAISNMFASVR